MTCKKDKWDHIKHDYELVVAIKRKCSRCGHTERGIL